MCWEPLHSATPAMCPSVKCTAYDWLMLPADAANATRDVLRTIAQCHSRNVLIRDVKPDNLLYLTPDDEAFLKAIDFGLAQ